MKVVCRLDISILLPWNVEGVYCNYRAFLAWAWRCCPAFSMAVIVRSRPTAEWADRRVQRKMSTANISEEIRAKFPLHSAVWENDYRKLEEQIRIPQVDETRNTVTQRSRTAKCYLLARWNQRERLNLFSHPDQVGRACWQMLRRLTHIFLRDVYKKLQMTEESIVLHLFVNEFLVSGWHFKSLHQATNPTKTGLSWL